MTRRHRVLAALAVMLGMAYALPAYAGHDFTLSKSVADGTFTLHNNTSDLFVDELVVGGLGATAGTTRSGWQATAFFFSDPLNCQGGTGFDYTSGFCYKLTDASIGTPIGAGAEMFTYDSSFDDQSLPSNFFVLFTNSVGTAYACSGTTHTGCDLPMPEPAPIAVFIIPLLGLAAMIRRRA